MKTPLLVAQRSKCLQQDARYASEAKQHEANKVERRAVLGILASMLSLTPSDMAVVLDDVGVESSRTIKHSTPLPPTNIIVFNYGSPGKIADMRAAARGVATVLEADAHHAMHLLPDHATGRVCIADCDFCCSATTILDGGSIQAVVPRMPSNKASVLALTYSRRNCCKHKAATPEDHIAFVVKLTAHRHGLRAHEVYMRAYGVMHARICVLVPAAPQEAKATRTLVQRVREAVASVAPAAALVATPLQPAPRTPRTPRSPAPATPRSPRTPALVVTSPSSHRFQKRVSLARNNTANSDSGDGCGMDDTNVDDEAAAEDTEYGYKAIVGMTMAGRRDPLFHVKWNDGSYTWEPKASFNDDDAYAQQSMRLQLAKARRFVDGRKRTRTGF
jgi:hypothetical protein